jgi:hypothetical protein
MGFNLNRTDLPRWSHVAQRVPFLPGHLSSELLNCLAGGSLGVCDLALTAALLAEIAAI